MIVLDEPCKSSLLIYFDDNMDKILFSTVLGTPTGPICIDTLEAPKGLVSFANFVTPVSTYTEVCCINQVCNVQTQVTLALCVTWSMDEPRGFSH